MFVSAIQASDEFNEGDHPRAENGEFGSGGAGKSKSHSGKPDAASLTKSLAAKMKATDDPHEKLALKFMKGVAEVDSYLSPEARKSNVFSYVQNGKDLGAAGRAKILDDGIAEITSLGSVAKGAGKRAMEDMIGQLKARGVKEVHLSAETGSAGFYEKMGFKNTGGDEYVLHLTAVHAKDAMAFDRGYRRDGKRIIPSDLVALDRSPSVRTYDMDGQLHISRSPISKANIGEYWGEEIPDFDKLGLEPRKKYRLLRDPLELEKGAKSSNGKQLLIEHVPVDADDHQPDITVGAFGTDAEYVHPYLYNSMTVHARDGISGIEDDSRRQISMGYHYKPVMEPGVYEGEAFDGRMTDIIFNHGCLVENGRAGADVLVGDAAITEPPDSSTQTGELTMSKIVLTRKAAMAGGAISAYLAPKLAQDSKFDIATVLKDVTSKNFKAKRPDIIAGVQKAMLAKDDTIDVKDLGKILDMVEASEVEEGADADPNSGLPMSAEEMEKKKAADADPVNKAKNFFKDKLSAEDWKAFDDMMGAPEALDETAEEKAAREKKEGEEAAARDAAAGEEPKVTTKAMDAAISIAVAAAEKRATTAALKTAGEIASAREFAAEFVGKLAMDGATSAADVFKGALDVLKVDVTGIHPSAYRKILELQSKISDKSKPRIASDSVPNTTGFDGRWGKTVERIGGAA